MPVFDNLLMTRSSANLTASVSSSGVKIYGTCVKGMAAYIVVPTNTGTTNSILPRVWVSDDDSTYYLKATYQEGAWTPSSAEATATAGKEFVVPLVTDMKYAKTELVITGSSGTPNFGVVLAGFVTGVGYDWDRGVVFD